MLLPEFQSTNIWNLYYDKKRVNKKIEVQIQNSFAQLWHRSNKRKLLLLLILDSNTIRIVHGSFFCPLLFQIAFRNACMSKVENGTHNQIIGGSDRENLWFFQTWILFKNKTEKPLNLLGCPKYAFRVSGGQVRAILW